MNIKEELNALKEWKLGGRGKTMSECIDWKNSHSQMFIEGYRVAKEKYCNEWHNLEENPNDLPIRYKNVFVKYISKNTEHISVSFCSEYNIWSHPLGLETDWDGYYYDYKILSWKEVE